MRNIVAINTHFAEGGAARIARRIAEDQVAKGNGVTMISGKREAPMPGVRQICIQELGRQTGRLARQVQDRIGLLDCLRTEAWGIPKSEAWRNADIIHLHNLHGRYFNPLALGRIAQGKKVVWTLHDMQGFTGHCAQSLDCARWRTGCGHCPYLQAYPEIRVDSSGLLWRLKSFAVNGARMTIVAPSQWMADMAKESLLRGNRIVTIPNGIDTSCFRPRPEARQELGLPRDRKIIMYAAHGGTKNPWKGGAFIERIKEELSGREDLLFLEVGGSSKSETSRLVQLPYVHDANTMALLYSAADVLLYPTRAETFGLVVAEAMASGLPVVSFRTGGVPELVDHRENGYLARSMEHEDLVAGLEWCLGGGDRRDKLGAMARKKILARFDEARMLDEYDRLYASM